MEEERTRLQKIVLISLAAMAVVFAILMIISRLHPGVLFNGALLKPSEMAEAVTYTGKIHGENISISVQMESNTVTVITCEAEGRRSDVYRMEYPLEPILAVSGFAEGEMVDGIRITKNGGVLFEGGYDRETSINEAAWSDADGQWDPGVVVTFSTGSGEQDGHLALNRWDVMTFANGPELTARGSWMLYFVMVFASILVALDAAFPLTMFRLNHMCDVRDPEPSDFYLAMQRIGWVLWPILILIGYIWALGFLP